MLTLMILSSKVCSSACSNLGLGGIMSISSGVLWFASAVLCCFVGEPVVNEDEQLPAAVSTAQDDIILPAVTQNQQVLEQTTNQQHVEEDGTIVIEKTTTRADGCVTVTTEVIPPGTSVASTVIAGKM